LDSPLPPFPTGPSVRLTTPSLLSEQGLVLRPLCDADVPWLREVYASTRREEMAMVPWPDETKRLFLEQQFALQHRHYLGQFPDASFLAIEHHEQGPLGNIFLRQSPTEHLLIHVALLPRARGRGIGTALIMQCQSEAAIAGCKLCLHVLQTNTAARRLYERLGFVVEHTEGAHWSMRWTPAGASRTTVS
jgi:ribosomal protein S18 acetylase RimI-like enzyme